MTIITVTHDDSSVDTFEFDANQPNITLGRRPANDVCLADRSVSGRHAVLEQIDGALWIRDLGSTNGTYINGKPVERQLINSDDDILVGTVRLRCASDTERTAASADHQAEPDGVAAKLDDSFADAMSDPALDAHMADDDDELDESMRAALALYSDDPAPESSSPETAFHDEDDDIDFSEDARLFEQSSTQSPSVVSPVDDLEDDRLPDADSSPQADEPLTLSDRAKVALGREAQLDRPRLQAVNGVGNLDPTESTSAPPVAQRSDAPSSRQQTTDTPAPPRSARPLAANGDNTGPTHELEPAYPRSRGAVIEIKNGAKSGQILPIDKPVTTLGRPGIQIAAIMRKPDGYFLMHIESDDSVERPTLNADSIGDEPVMLHSGDELNVAGIDVEFMLS